MNVFCLGGNVIGRALAFELLEMFLTARFSGAARHCRRIAKVQALEQQSTNVLKTFAKFDGIDRNASTLLGVTNALE